MNIETFAIQRNKSEKTVKKWIKEGLIPGSNLEENYIPDSARVPYTARRARTAKAIYSSIVNASNNQMHVLPLLYQLSEDEFQGYIRRLVEADLIEERVTDGITYYDATIKGSCASKKTIWKAIKEITGAATYGAVRAVLNNSGQ